MKKNILPPPITGVLALALMWGVDQILPATRFAFPGQGLLAIMVIGAGLWLDVIALRTFRKAGTTTNPVSPEKASTLVDHGVFSKSRNPIYVALVLFLIGGFLWFGNLANVLVIAAFIWFMTNFQIKPEEEALTKIFGQPYDDYREKVRRWI